MSLVRIAETKHMRRQNLAMVNKVSIIAVSGTSRVLYTQNDNLFDSFSYLNPVVTPETLQC